MNEFSALFAAVNSGDVITLEKNRIYHARQDDSFDLTGFFCSNSASINENPNGQKYAALFLQNKKNVVIDGNGARLLVHGKMTYFLLDHCENITIKNLTLDYACPTMTECTVLENRDGVVTLRINEDCLYRVEGNRLYWRGETGADGQPYWEDAAEEALGSGGYRYALLLDPKDLTTRPFNCRHLTFSHIETTQPHTLRCTLKDPQSDLPEGFVLQTRNVIRDQVGGMFQRCKDLHFENLRVLFMHGLGLVSQFCENITYENCDMTPKPGRTLTSTADFFHFSGCRGLVHMSGCRMFGAQDDPVNVHGTHLRIVEADPRANTLLVRFCHNQTWGLQAFETGDELEFIRWDTLIPYAQTVVTGYEKRNDTDILLHVASLPEGIVLEKDVVENASWTADLHIHDCYFGPTAGRGILCTTRGKVIIENNRFETLRGPALVVEDDCNFWYESGYTREILFRNNQVISCCYGKSLDVGPVIQYTPKVMDRNSTSFVHGRLIATGNRFTKPRFQKHTFWLEYLAEAVITDNTFDAPYEIVTKCCGSVTDRDNVLAP